MNMGNKINMMKNVMILAFFITGMNLTAQEVTTEQWTHIQKRTAHWCSNCGTWGWNFNESLHSEFTGQNVLIWNSHISSSDLSNPTSIAIAENYGGSGQPRFFIDGADISLNPSNGNEKLTEVAQVVESNNSLPAFFGCASTATYDGSTIDVNSKAKLFFDSEQSVISMAVYLMKKETIAPQSGQGSNAVHKNLIVDHLTDDVFGETIVNGNGMANDEHSFTTSLDITEIDPSEYQIVTVLWAYIAENDKYQFLNANITKINNTVDTQDEIALNTEIKVNTTNKSAIAVDIDSRTKLPKAIISIYNTTGQMVTSKTTSIDKGSNNYSFDLGSSTSGIYFLYIASEKSSLTRQFILN